MRLAIHFGLELFAYFSFKRKGRKEESSRQLFNCPNLILQALIIRQQVIDAVLAQDTAFEVLRQLAGLVGLEVLAPLRRVVIGLQLGDVVFQLGEVLEGGFQSFDDLLALVEEGFHVCDAFDACHNQQIL